jgi:hypothetical protein
VAAGYIVLESKATPTASAEELLSVLNKRSPKNMSAQASQ